MLGFFERVGVGAKAGGYVTDRRTFAFRTILTAMHYSGVSALFDKSSAHLGALLTFHHVRPDQVPEFCPNGHLSVHPKFFEETIQHLKHRGYDFVSLTEACQRIKQADNSKRFVAFTFDDGYRNNLEVAAPIMQKYGVPYTVFVATGLIDGSAELWWEGIEALVRKCDKVTTGIGQRSMELDCSTLTAKQNSYKVLLNYLVQVLPEREVQNFVRELCRRYEIDLSQIRTNLMMTWDEVRQMKTDPLCTIGAHTLTHPALARLEESEAQEELLQGATVLEARLGDRPTHIAYPYGTEEAAGQREFDLATKCNYVTGVTTRPGMIFAEHRDHLTALPRISLNGFYQSKRFLLPLLSGLPTKLLNRGQVLNVT